MESVTTVKETEHKNRTADDKVFPQNYGSKILIPLHMNTELNNQIIG